MYNKISKLNDEQFRRKTGVKRNTFLKMVEIVFKAEIERKKLSGRPLKLNYENQVLMMLEYLREYRTYFSLGQIHGISEANCYKICKKIEDILIKADEFKLPNRKDLYEDPNIEVVVVDATESPIERPQKNKGNTIQVRKRNTQLKPKLLLKRKQKRF
jgi:Helix-turn-helix of DDE superfamily endonuclease